MTSVIATDRALHAMKPASELRQASLMTGRRFLEEVAIHTESPVLAAYRDAVASEDGLGNYAVAFGVVAAALDIESRFVPGAVLLSSATAVLQSAMRLMRVSHRDVQGILHRLRPLVARLAGEVLEGRMPGSLSGFHPLQDIASMRHANAEARLFAS